MTAPYIVVAIRRRLEPGEHLSRSRRELDNLLPAPDSAELRPVTFAFD
jgi:hypothetical protein